MKSLNARHNIIVKDSFVSNWPQADTGKIEKNVKKLSGRTVDSEEMSLEMQIYDYSVCEATGFDEEELYAVNEIGVFAELHQAPDDLILKVGDKEIRKTDEMCSIVLLYHFDSNFEITRVTSYPMGIDEDDILYDLTNGNMFPGPSIQIK